MEFELPLVRTVLAVTPETLRTWLDGLPTADCHANEGPDTWSPYDVVGHLARVMAKNFRPAVGPWRQYLPILG